LRFIEHGCGHEIGRGREYRVKVFESIGSFIGKRALATTNWKSEDPVEVVLITFIFIGYILLVRHADCGVSVTEATVEVLPTGALVK
jgi:hypothetical protein